MIVFYCDRVCGSTVFLPAEESAHCVRVLRHRTGDEIRAIDGEGTLYTCELTDDNPSAAQARIIGSEPGWGAHPYRLIMAVCPTKNIDRYEWMAEKVTEMGLDVLCPVMGDHSERRVLNTGRLAKILLSAAKQSLKGAIPAIPEPESVKDFIKGCDADIKLIACCFEGDVPRVSVAEAIGAAGITGRKPEIAILIGPEGDFSPEEVRQALDSGFIPVHLGESRLRTETAALVAACAVYLHFS